jgi:hypothetical protein
VLLVGASQLLGLLGSSGQEHQLLPSSSLHPTHLAAPQLHNRQQQQQRSRRRATLTGHLAARGGQWCREVYCARSLRKNLQLLCHAGLYQQQHSTPPLVVWGLHHRTNNPLALVALPACLHSLTHQHLHQQPPQDHHPQRHQQYTQGQYKERRVVWSSSSRQAVLANLWLSVTTCSRTSGSGAAAVVCAAAALGCALISALAHCGDAVWLVFQSHHFCTHHSIVDSLLPSMTTRQFAKEQKQEQIEHCTHMACRHVLWLHLAAAAPGVWSCSSKAFCPRALRAWSHRWPRIVAELQQYDADIICLQVGMTG